MSVRGREGVSVRGGREGVSVKEGGSTVQQA